MWSGISWIARRLMTNVALSLTRSNFGFNHILKAMNWHKYENFHRKNDLILFRFFFLLLLLFLYTVSHIVPKWKKDFFIYTYDTVVGLREKLGWICFRSFVLLTIEVENYFSVAQQKWKEIVFSTLKIIIVRSNSIIYR